jgi:hypothetical protein
MPNIQTKNLEQTFREMRDARGLTPSNVNIHTASTIRPVVQEVEKHAQMIGGGTSVSAISRVAPAIWSPLLQITSMVLPKTLTEKNLWRRWYYEHDPYVGTALDLHTKYPISTFRLRCDEDPEGHIAEEYEEIAEDIDLFQLLLWIGQEYWVVGEAFPFGIWNEDDLTWDSFILLTPDYVDVQKDPFAQRDPIIAITRWEPRVKAVVENGPNDPRTGLICQHWMNNAQDLYWAVKNNMPYPLSPMAVSHIARKTFVNDLRGTSIIDKIFKVLMYQDRLQTAQMAGADRYQTPVELWTVGNDEYPATQEDLTSLENVLLSTWNSPQKAVLWYHTLKAEMVGGAGSLLPLPPEFEWINKEKMAALMVNESILTGNGPTYASASVAMDYMVSWYTTYRQQLEKWMRKNVFEPVGRARGYFKVPKKEIVGGYRDKTVRRRVIVPDIVWDKVNLRDDYQKLQTFQQLAEQNRIAWSNVLEMINLDPATENKKIERENKEYQAMMARMGMGVGTGMGAAPAMGGGGMMPPPMMGGGGGGDLGAPPMEEMGGGIGEIMPETGPESPGGNAFPPESVGASPGSSGSGFS